jgi:assimilatory nitrate reductase catalytic subunit
VTAEARYPVVAPGVGDFRGASGEPAAHWKATAAGERLVPTRCSFCGVQCGMYLRVADGRVIGVEPRRPTAATPGCTTAA